MPSEVTPNIILYKVWRGEFELTLLLRITYMMAVRYGRERKAVPDQSGQSSTIQLSRAFPNPDIREVE